MPLETGNLQNKKHTVRFKQNKDDPIDEAEFNTSSAAYFFASKIEENGGIAIVRMLESPSYQQLQKPRLNFD